eukprot:gene10372-19191_t
MTCGLQPSWKQMQADDDGQAQTPCPSSSAVIYFQGALPPPIASGAYFPDCMRAIGLS